MSMLPFSSSSQAMVVVQNKLVRWSVPNIFNVTIKRAQPHSSASLFYKLALLAK